MREVDKMIVDLILDDEMLHQAHEEIDAARTLGDFAPMQEPTPQG